LDNSTASFPKTGTCIDAKTVDCTGVENEKKYCYIDALDWGFCPFCRTFKDHDDHGGHIPTGTYVSGTGYHDKNNPANSDPQMFEGGSSVNCRVERTAEVYYYCWYDKSPGTIVSLDYWETFWDESAELCHYIAYVYTPLACNWATENIPNGG